MNRLKKQVIVQTLLEDAILPIFCHSDENIAVNILKACIDGGVRAVEFVARGKRSIEVFRAIITYRNAHFPKVFVGAGTIYDQQSANVFLREGADFIVSPVFSKEIALTCNRQKILWIPGCGTMTEIAEAESYGGELIKVFPAVSLGPDFIKNVLGPSPDSCLMASGGIKSEIVEINKWVKAGAACVGLGSDLFPIELIEKGNFEPITATIKKIVQSIKDKKIPKSINL